jgi:hypothetical protein
LNRRSFSASTEASRECGLVARTVVDSAAPVYRRVAPFHKLKLSCCKKPLDKHRPRGLREAARADESADQGVITTVVPTLTRS